MGVMKIGKTLMNSLFAEPETSRYPEEAMKLSQLSRGSIVIDETRCTLCRLCGRRCPSGAIVPERKDSRLLIDRMKCIVCGECISVCPEEALTMAREYVAPDGSVLIDVYRAAAKAGSDSVLEGLEMPPEELHTEDEGRSIRTREVQRIRRNKRRDGSGKTRRRRRRNRPN